MLVVGVAVAVLFARIQIPQRSLPSCERSKRGGQKEEEGMLVIVVGPGVVGVAVALLSGES